jgi:hypothetical protein
MKTMSRTIQHKRPAVIGRLRKGGRRYVSERHDPRQTVRRRARPAARWRVANAGQAPMHACLARAAVAQLLGVACCVAPLRSGEHAGRARDPLATAVVRDGRRAEVSVRLQRCRRAGASCARSEHDLVVRSRSAISQCDLVVRPRGRSGLRRHHPAGCSDLADLRHSRCARSERRLVSRAPRDYGCKLIPGPSGTEERAQCTDRHH